MRTGIGRKPTDADYGLGEHTFNADNLGLMDENELTERLISTFSNPSYRPPKLPAVATELLSLSQRPDVEFSAIESVLERDPMLAGDVFKVARSATFSGIRQMATLREALIRIGLGTMRDVVMQAAMNMRVFRGDSYRECMERLRIHSTGTAHLSRIVSHYTAIGEEQAFLCGLLHDAGIAGTLLVLGDVKKGQKAPDLSGIWPAIHRAHARAGARMTELWKLPEEVGLVVGAHHDVRVDNYDHPMAATVCIAESLTEEIGMGLIPPGEPERKRMGLEMHQGIDRTDPRTVARAVALLGLTEKQLELIRADAREWARSESEEHAGRG